MDAVTYPHGGVERRLHELFVAFKPQIEQNEPLARKFQVVWTPGLLFVDGSEIVRYRTYGYHPPEDMEHLLHVGHGTVEFHRGNYTRAVESFSRAADDPERTALQPEALYWLGVSLYKTGDKEGMKKAWNRLLDTFPQDLWAKKASFIRPAAASAAA